MSTWLDIWFGRFLMLAALAFFSVMGIEGVVELRNNDITPFFKIGVDAVFTFWLIDLGREYERVESKPFDKQFSSTVVAIAALAEIFVFGASADFVGAVAFTGMTAGFVALSRHWKIMDTCQRREQ